MRFSDRVAIITGAGQGIGKSIASLFAREGARVVVCDVQKPLIQTTVNEINEGGGTAMGVTADVSSRTDVDALVRKTLESYGALHILVNNAGIFRYGSLLDIEEIHWDRTMNVDLKGVLYCMQAAAPHMISQNYGKIINISSSAGIGGYENMASYATAKAGVMQLTRVAAREFGKYGINVNAIAPGIVITPGSRGTLTEEQLAKFVEKRKRVSCLGRVGMPEDISRVVLFLASEDSGYITGQTIAVDGGRSDYMA